MILLRLSFLTGFFLIVESSSGIKLDPNVGSNWLIPLRTTTTTASPSAFSNLDITTPSPGDASVYYNSENFQDGQSSFVPTISTASSHRDTSRFYPISHPQNQYYFQYQHLPNTHSYSIVPFVGGPPPESAMQRQEFFAVNPNVVTVGQGDFEVSAPAPGPPAPGPPAPGPFGGLPSIGDIFGGIGGAASNTAQAIGLGGLGVLGSALVFLVGAPLLIFAVAFPVAIMVFAILGLPVIQLTLPASDGAGVRRLKSGFMESARIWKEVLESEECLERLSCGIARRSRRLPYESWILKKMDNISNTWANRISKSVKMGRSGENCEKFICTPMTKLRHMVETITEKSSH